MSDDGIIWRRICHWYKGIFVYKFVMVILCVTQHSIDRGRNLKNWPLFLDGLFPLYFLPSMTSEWMLVFLYFGDMFVVFWIWYDFEIKCFLFGIGYEQYMLLLLTFCILNKYKQCLKSDNSSSWNMYTIYIYLEIFRLCFKWMKIIMIMSRFEFDW